jgi:hypothetical protein
MPPAFNLLLTLGVLFSSVGIVVYLARLERRPRQKLEPRLIPTTPMIVIFSFIGLLALVHLFNLYGIHTGRR